MPDSHTFNIKTINQLIHRYLNRNLISIDPFANNSKLTSITNDINPEYNTDYHLDALDFLKQFPNNSIDLILYDPPYSPRQVSECYKKLNKTVDMKTTQSSYWSNQKTEIARIIRPGGKVITCSWNSGGVGKKYGFKIIEILLVPHGGWHNDTIVTVDENVNKIQKLKYN